MLLFSTHYINQILHPDTQFKVLPRPFRHGGIQEGGHRHYGGGTQL